MKIIPARRLRGTVRVPGDKSVSHRAAMIGALAEGETRITNFSAAEDCRTTLRCLEQLGVQFRQDGAETVVSGAGKHGLRRPDGPLDCGNSGTTARLLAGILAGQTFDTVLTGDASLRSRPMERVMGPLRQMGAVIEADDGRLPMTIFGGHPLEGITYKMPVASAQVKSCILLAGLFARGTTAVVEPASTRDHTERMLRWFGVEVKRSGSTLEVGADGVLAAREVVVPADLSSAAFFMIAAACLGGSELVLTGVGTNSTRSGILTILRDLGVGLEVVGGTGDASEPYADIMITGGLAARGGGRRYRLSGPEIPVIIDELPVLAVMGTQLDGGLEIRDAAELRKKESDRIATVAENLKRMGAVVEELPDGLIIERSDLKGARIDPFGDHRIAMAFAVAGLLAEGDTHIDGAECVEISFPRFFDVLKSVAE